MGDEFKMLTDIIRLKYSLALVYEINELNYFIVYV